MWMRIRTAGAIWLAVVALGLPSARAQEAPASKRFTGPWDVPALLADPPAATWGEAKGGVREVYYEGEPLDGKPTRVFAYYARPESGDGPFPAMVLVHGGGGKAFREWAELWAERGYVALAMDLAGHGPTASASPTAGPSRTTHGKFRDFDDDEVRQMWTYHAVAAVLRGALAAGRAPGGRPRPDRRHRHQLGRLPDVHRRGDRRPAEGRRPGLRLRLPPREQRLDPPLREDEPRAAGSVGRELRPVALPAGRACPILFVNGTNDFAYPLGSYRKSYRLVNGPRTLCVTGPACRTDIPRAGPRRRSGSSSTAC